MNSIDHTPVYASFQVGACVLGRLACLSLLVLGTRLPAASLYWDGAGGSWGTPASWSTDPSEPLPDPAAAPGSGDTALFSIAGITNLHDVVLDADQAAAKLRVLDSATGGVTLLGTGAPRLLSLGSGGIEVASGSGPLTIGSVTAGHGVTLSLAASQSWTNSSASPLTVNGAVTNSAAATLTLAGNGRGRFVLNGPVSNGAGATALALTGTGTVTLAAANTYSNGTTLSSASTLVIGHNQALGSGALTVNSGSVRVENHPRALANKVVLNATSGSFWAGDASLTLTGNGATPAVAITRNAAPTIHIVNTAPMTISGVFSLCDSSLPNNNPQGPALASGANLLISGDIIECNAGNTPSANNRGAKFVFNGAGANLTLTGTNGFGAGANIGRSTEINAAVGSAFNSVTVGRPAGSDKAIAPFGRSVLYTNSGVGFYLMALEDGLTITNDFSLGASTSNDGARPIGFDGTHDLSLGGAFLLGASVTFPNLATGTLSFSGTLNTYSRILTIQGPGTTVFASNSVITGTTGGIGKQGPGTLTLAGFSDTPGPTTLNGGTVVLDYTLANASRLTPGTNATTALTLGGVDLQLKGGSYAQTLGSGGGTTIGSGQSRVRRTAGGTSTIALGAITRNATVGGVIDFASGVASTTTGNTGGLLGGYGCATVDGADWAVGGGPVTPLSAYDSFAVPGTDKNILLTGSGSTAGTSVSTLKIVPAAPGESLTLGGLVTLSRGGLLFLGSEDYAITGGSLRGRTEYQGDLCIHTYGSGTLTIGSQIANGNTMSLVKAGPGTLTLTCPTNSYSGPTFLNNGVLAVAASNSLGSGVSGNTLVLNGGTLRATSGFAMSRAVTLNFNGGTFQVDNGTLELGGLVGGSYGALKKTGAGTLLLSNTNLFNGPVIISEGTLKMGSASPLGISSTVANRSISPVTVEAAGVLDLAGQTNFIGAFTLDGGRVADSVGGGQLGAYRFTLQSGLVEAVLTDVVVPNASNPSHSINLYKRTSGNAVLAATNLYSGTTFIEAGTLTVNGALSASPVNVLSEGTLRGTGTLQRAVSLEGGTLAPGPAPSLPGTLTLGRHLLLGGSETASGTLRVAIGPAGHSKIVLTHPEALVHLENVQLDLAVSTGSSATLNAGMTIIDNRGNAPIQGTFVGLPEGASFETGGRPFTLTYAGGDGNDVVLTSTSKGTLITVR